MAKSSIKKNFIIKGKKQVKIFADAIEKSSKHINPCENCEFGYGKSWIDKDGIFHLETCKEKQDCIRMKEK